MNRIALILPFAALLATGCAGDRGLHLAARTNDASGVRALLSQGAKVNSTVGLGKLTPLHFAAMNGAQASAQALIDGGADVFASSIYGTPREAALSHRNIGGIARLLEKAERKQQGLPDDTAEVRPAAAPRPAPGNLDDAAYDRMRAAAGMPPEKKAPSSDIDAPARRGAERPDDFALVIGIEEYQSLPKADFGARDAKTVRRHLEALGFPARNIISLEGSQATGSKLKSYLEEWLPLNVKAGSTLFVYYSGHGAPDTKTGEAYLVPWDGDPKFLKSTALPLKRLYADLAKTKARRVIVALDACFSGAGGRSVLAQGARPLVAKAADLAPTEARLTILAAASGDEITGTLAEQSHGLFTYHLLKGLSADPKASAKSLFDYLKPRVQDDARRENREQTPVLAGSALGEPLLAP
ncbi:MAG: caspase family protein [Elusimicrobia bacterium]|nr:caspase family protein [Elusimicrobiota bacterium]